MCSPYTIRWDYGQLKLYMSNNLKLLLPDDNHEAATMRSYFKVKCGVCGVLCVAQFLYPHVACFLSIHVEGFLPFGYHHRKRDWKSEECY